MTNWMRVAALLAWVGLSPAAGAVELSGELDWANRVTLSIPFTGRMKQVAVQPGDLVDAGQELLRIDTRIVTARAAQSRAAVKRLDLQRAEAKREWERARELFERTVLSVRELQLAEIGYHVADADYQAARAALVAAEVELENLQPTAPFAARVLAVHVAPGQAVVNTQQATPLVTLAAPDRMLARAAVNAAQAADLAGAQAVTVRVGNRSFEGRVVHVGAEPLGPERPALYAVVAEFAVPADAVLRAGQSATLILP
jgi:membrane fusion protein, multidrug efflux system